MAAPDNSLLLDATFPEAYWHENDDHETVGESRNKPPNDLPAASADAEPSGGSARGTSTPNTPLPQDDSAQATFIFVVGDHRFSDSYELGTLDEHPEALEAITSNPCLSTSAFLKPALQAAMTELQPSLMVPAAVRLTAISLWLVAGVLRDPRSSQQREGTDQGQQQELSKMVQHELEQAVPYYHWQGLKHYCGRVQYLMALLEEAVRVMAVSKHSLAEALKLDAAADDASHIVFQSIQGLERWKEQFVGNLNAVFPPDNFENRATCQTMLSHAHAAMRLRMASREASLQWTTVLHRASWYTRERGMLTEAETRSKLCEWTRVKVLGKAHPDTLRSMANLALTYHYQGRWGEAEELEVNVMETGRKVMGETHPNTLASMANLASTDLD